MCASFPLARLWSVQCLCLCTVTLLAGQRRYVCAVCLSPRLSMWTFTHLVSILDTLLQCGGCQLAFCSYPHECDLFISNKRSRLGQNTFQCSWCGPLKHCAAYQIAGAGASLLRTGYCADQLFSLCLVYSLSRITGTRTAGNSHVGDIGVSVRQLLC